jgi:hypothetical protein
LWREHVLIGFAPERLSALALGRWPRQRLIDRHSVPLSAHGPADWDKGLEALQLLLAEPAWNHRAIHIVLSSHYVRHAIIPDASTLSAEAIKALAGAIFAERYGELARDWELAVSATGGNRKTLACGAPRALLSALRMVSNNNGHLHSIEPSLMPVFNRIRGQIKHTVGCVALVEIGRITLACFDDEQWTYVDSRASDGSSLPQLLLEAGDMNDRQPGGLLWLCDFTGRANLPAGTLWSHRRISPPHISGVEADGGLAIWGLR